MVTQKLQSITLCLPYLSISFLSISQSREHLYDHFDGAVDYVRELATSASIRAIHFNAQLSAHQWFIDVVKTDAKLRKLVVYPEPSLNLEDSEFDIPSPLDPLFVPLLHASAVVRDMVWSRALWFAMDIDQYKDGFSPKKSRLSVLRRNRVTFPLISKAFHRLSLPHLCGYPIISSDCAFKLVGIRIMEHSTLGSYIRSLHFHDFYFWDPPHNEILHQVLSRAPNIVRLDSISPLPMLDIIDYRAHLQWDGFETLGNSAGFTLVTIRNLVIDDVPEAIRTPTIFF